MYRIKKYMIGIAILTGFVLTFNACYYDKEQLLYPVSFNCSGAAPSFSKEVMPIINTSCVQGSGCHGAGSSHGPGALTTYSQISNAGSQVLSSVLNGRMPLGSALSAAQIKTINCWVSNNMPNN